MSTEPVAYSLLVYQILQCTKIVLSTYIADWQTRSVEYLPGINCSRFTRLSDLLVTKEVLLVLCFTSVYLVPQV